VLGLFCCAVFYAMSFLAVVFGDHVCMLVSITVAQTYSYVDGLLGFLLFNYAGLRAGGLSYSRQLC